MYEWTVADGERVRIDAGAEAKAGEEAVFHTFEGKLRRGTLLGFPGDLISGGEIIRFPPGDASPVALLFYDGLIRSGAYRVPEGKYYVKFSGFPQVVPQAARLGRVASP